MRALGWLPGALSVKPFRPANCPVIIVARLGPQTGSVYARVKTMPSFAIRSMPGVGNTGLPVTPVAA